ncbi:hypothetical protein SAMN02799622_05222 [Methylobacterium sp. UNC378MF]|uniref:hypothetical protein n=1 Tax=Methylobacterium sp. UNC378MF TaxID=1502748 RepID=UPI00087E52E2|nr:hypothetical protein [Methylobacterium sp. UNC378MF]SDA32349.1 hypothetical protein SAMN02799622_05222 [Methylobacterium sp. UNC378MF]
MTRSSSRASALSALPPLTLVLRRVGIAALALNLVCVVYFRIRARAGATNLSRVTVLVLVPAILSGALVLGERVDARHLSGMVLFAVGLAATDGRLLRRRDRPARSAAGAAPER